MKYLGTAILAVFVLPLAPALALLWVASKLPAAHPPVQHSVSPGFEVLNSAFYSNLSEDLQIAEQDTIANVGV